jgi:MFS family permease
MIQSSNTRPASWRYALKGNVLTLGIVSLFTDLSSEMIYPLLPVFFTGLVPSGLAAVYVGIMEGVAESTASILKLISGRLSDRTGRRKILVVAGYGMSTVCRPLMAVAAAGWQIIALRFADRIGKGVRTAPRDALIGDSVVVERRGLAFGFHRAMDHAGAIAGSLAAIAILYAFLGYGLWTGGESTASDTEMRALRWLFVFSILPGLAALMVLMLKVHEPAQTERSIAPSFEGYDESASSSSLPRRFYWYVGIVCLFALGNSSDLFLVFYGKTMFQLGLLQLIGLWIALHLSKIVFGLPGSAASDRWSRRTVILVGWGVYALVYIGLALANSVEFFWVLIVVYGLYYGLTEGAERALVADFVESGRRGAAYGVFHGATGLAALPASVLFGLVWKLLGPRIAFTIGASLAGIAALLLAALLSTGKQSRD